MEMIVCLVVGYFCGCISSGYFVGKFYKKDIKRVVHIVDMDGAYIPDNNIVFDDSSEEDKNVKTKDIKITKDGKELDFF